MPPRMTSRAIARQIPAFPALLIGAALLIPLALPAFSQDDVIGHLVLTETQVIPRANPAQGQVIIGTLPGGAVVEVDLRGDGSIDEISAAGIGTFPISAIEHVIPEAIRNSEAWPAGAMLEEVDFERNGEIDLEGWLADGREFEATFDANGNLIDLDIDDD